MPDPYLIDNDIILKIATFQQNIAFLDLLTVECEKPAILGVGAYVVRQKSRQRKKFQNPLIVASSVDALLKELQHVEPTDAEIEVAAEFESCALKLGGAFDTGEAQLLAVLISRSFPAMVTGDKRAVMAIMCLPAPAALNKIICLEQIMARLVVKGEIASIRSCVCTESKADKAMANCFACASVASHALGAAAALQALQSYIDNLRQQSGGLLMDDDKLLSLTT